MKTEDFQNFFDANGESFKKWGDFVSCKIKQALEAKIGADDAKIFIKLPVIPRVKDIDSAIGKIARKGYDDPIHQITDFVGVRFVVLLSDHITAICKIIETESSWIGVLSKDYQDEIAKNPKIFDYQSQHFEVRPKETIEFEGCHITTDICCEVQIRTLLQHAYAELVHDSIYKPVGLVPHQAERQVARSMALMETTDELFCNTMKLLTDSNKPRNDLLDDLTSLYREKIAGHLLRTDLKTNYALLDEFRESIQDGLAAEIASFIENKKYISVKTQSRAPSNAFFAQPALLFVYWLAAHTDIKDLHNRWPLPGYINDLETILSDIDG